MSCGEARLERGSKERREGGRERRGVGRGKQRREFQAGPSIIIFDGLSAVVLRWEHPSTRDVKGVVGVFDGQLRFLHNLFK